MMTLRQAKEYRRRIEGAAEPQDDEKALENVDLFRRWSAGEDVAAGDRRQDEGILYKCIQPHRTQADWKPKDTPALWRKVGEVEVIEENSDTPPEWAQPAGGHDAYSKGDRVSFNGEVYESLIDGNVWSPAAYPAGWKMAE